VLNVTSGSPILNPGAGYIILTYRFYAAELRTATGKEAVLGWAALRGFDGGLHKSAREIGRKGVSDTNQGQCSVPGE